MAEDRVQVDKAVLLELGSYMREVFPKSEPGDFYRGTYAFDDIFVQYVVFLTNNIEILYNGSATRTFYDNSTEEYYLSRENYISFNKFLDEVCIKNTFKHWNKCLDFLHQLVGTPMVKAAK